MKRVLFVSHEASRTGAPIVFLHFLRWLRANTDLEMEILLTNRGPLTAEFEALAPVVVVRRKLLAPGGTWREQLIRRNRVNWRLRGIKDRLCSGQIDLVYSNTAVNGEILSRLAPSCPVITHVHELEYALVSCCTAREFELTRDLTTRWVAVANAVKANLVRRRGISAGQVDVVYECIPAPELSPETWTSARERIRAELGIPPEAFVVGSVGTLDWRKGGDLVPLLLSALRRRPSQIPLHFVWVGEVVHPHFLVQIRQSLDDLGLQSVVHFTGEKSNPLDYVAALDVFALLSREDPYPLVCLEAASVGRPIVCFPGSGGMPEFVEDDCGLVVPHLDIDPMAEAIARLRDDPELRRRAGACAARKVRQRHDVEVTAPRLYEIMQRLAR